MITNYLLYYSIIIILSFFFFPVFYFYYKRIQIQMEKRSETKKKNKCIQFIIENIQFLLWLFKKKNKVVIISFLCSFYVELENTICFRWLSFGHHRHWLNIENDEISYFLFIIDELFHEKVFYNFSFFVSWGKKSKRSKIDLLSLTVEVVMLWN